MCRHKSILLTPKYIYDDADENDLIEIPAAVPEHEVTDAFGSVEEFQDLNLSHIPFINRLFLEQCNISCPVHVQKYCIDMQLGQIKNSFCPSCFEDSCFIYELRDDTNVSIAYECSVKSENELLRFLRNPESYCNDCGRTLLKTLDANNCCFCNTEHPEHQNWIRYKQRMLNYIERQSDYPPNSPW